MTPPTLSARDQDALNMIAGAAERGDYCPSNGELAFVMGCESIASGARIIASFEKAGLITVVRFPRARVITIVATGKSTHDVGGVPVEYLRGQGRKRAPWPPKRLLDDFAEKLSTIGDVAACGEALGIGRAYSFRLFKRLRDDLGAQAV